MNFSAQVKNEILTDRIQYSCCKRAALSAFLRTAGTVEIRHGKIGFSTSSEHSINQYFAQIIYDLYGATGETVIDEKGDRSKFTLISDVGLKILIDTQVLLVDRNGIEVQLSIDEKILKKKCCQRAFLKGAFLGAGSITVPKINSQKATGYHLEFVFSKYVTAQDFAQILSDNGYIAKLIERKDSFVVYFKHSEEICDLLVLMGAQKQSLALTEIIVTKTVMNNTNRVFNCEMSNLNKQVDASLKVRTQIETIDRLLGLDKLPLPLKEVACARMEYPNDTLSQLATRLNLTKSCLSHRLKKLCEIADGL